MTRATEETTIMTGWKKTVACGALSVLFPLAAQANAICREATRPSFPNPNDVWEAWPVHVRELPKKDGDCPRYVLQQDENQNAPEHQYAAIRPVLLDNGLEDDYSEAAGPDDPAADFINLPQEHRLGFVAYQHDEGFALNDGLLLDSHGKAIIPNRFNGFSVLPMFSDAAGALIRLERNEPDDNNLRHTWLYFKNGRPVHRAPHWYASSYTVAINNATYAIMATENTPNPMQSVLRMADLREIASSIQGEARVTTLIHSPVATFILARETVPGKFVPRLSSLPSSAPPRPLTRVRLYDEDFQPIALPEFHDVEYHYQSHSVAFLNHESMDCRLYSVQPGSSALYAIIDEPVPLQAWFGGICPDFDDNNILVSGTETESRIFIREKSGKAVLSAELPGKVVGHNGNKVFIVRNTHAGKPMYRVFDGAGKLLRDEWFEDYRDWGNLIVRYGNEWYSLRSDGALSTDIRFPFSR
jgi:hypothetical protein